jgi:hypothetical protein
MKRIAWTRDAVGNPQESETLATALRPARLTLQANADIARAAEWYEERSEGLGKRFVDRVEAITRIEANPEGYAPVFKNLRRCNVAKFPYALWFEVRFRQEPDDR